MNPDTEILPPKPAEPSAGGASVPASRPEPNRLTPATPEGFWTLGGRDGLSGRPEKVKAIIEANERIPAHGKLALTSAIDAVIEGTEYNYIQVFATAARRTEADTRHDLVTFDLRSSTKNL